MAKRTLDPTVAKRIQFLQSIPLFAQLSEEELITLLDDLHPRQYGRDEIIFRHGDESRELYIVFSGKVRIFTVSPAGDETSIYIFSTGDVIGELAAMDGEPRNATAKAINNVTLLAMAHERFDYYLHTMPKLALGLAHLLRDKLRWTAAYAESIAQFDAAGRLLHILLFYTERYGQRKQTTDGRAHYVLDLSLNQTDLASLVGARREWINRILNDWRKRGLIEYSSGTLEILDLERVRAERDSRIEANHADSGW